MPTAIQTTEESGAVERATLPGDFMVEASKTASACRRMWAQAERAQTAARASCRSARQSRLRSLQVRFAVRRSRDVWRGAIYAISVGEPGPLGDPLADGAAAEQPTVEEVAAVLGAVDSARNALESLSACPKALNPLQFSTVRVAAAILSEAVDLVVQEAASGAAVDGASAPGASTVAKLRYRALALSLWQRTPDPAVRQAIELGLYGAPDSERAREEAERLADLAARWIG